MADLSDYTGGYDFESVASNADAIEFNGRVSRDINAFNSIPRITPGKTGSFCRGPLTLSGPNYFSEATLFDVGYDIRGAVSCSASLWFQLGDLTADHFLYSIHDPTSANGQAFLLTANDVTAKCPRVFIMDGLASFNGVQVTATGSTTPIIQTNIWQYVAFSYDTALNLIRMFWGRAVGESYQNSASGFAAGFGYDGVTGLGPDAGVHLGKFTGGGTPATVSRVDQFLWWKDRALTFQEMSLIWNNDEGVEFSELANLGLSDGSDYNFYWGRR